MAVHADPTTDEAVLPGHAWAETKHRHPGDGTLRARGFHIRARPKVGEAVWVRGGHVYGQAEALRLAARER